MTTEWYLFSVDEILDFIGLSEQTFVGGPPQPVQVVRHTIL